MKEYFRRWFGWLLPRDKLQTRVERLEVGQANLEVRVVTAEDAAQHAPQEPSRLVRHFELPLEQLPPPDDLFTSVDTAMVDDDAREAAAIVERYGFQRFIPPIEQPYPSAVISMQEFQEHPELYFHKLKKGFLGFPIGLNFKEVNKLLFERYGNIQMGDDSVAHLLYSPNGTVNFFLEMLLRRNSSPSTRNVKAQEKAAQQLIQAAGIADLNRCNSNEFLHIDSLDFLANYPGLAQYVLDLPEVTRKEKNQALQAFQTVRLVYLTALEIVSQTQIKPTTDLLDCAADSLDEKVIALSTDNSGAASLKYRLRNSLLSETRGTSYHELQKLLTVRSKGHFRRLAHERTQEILTRDQKYAGLTDRLGKELKDYSVGESVVLSCYFARIIIQHYASLNDAVRAVFSGQRDERISGKCTDYTGLALQYLREYLVPLHPEKFKNWTFGYDTERIGGYDHCYIKAIHQRPDEFIDVYFIDPTLLASRGIDGLKTPQEVIELMDTANHPIQIVRDAEDLLRKKTE